MWESEIERIMVPDQPRQKFMEKNWVWWFMLVIPKKQLEGWLKR
jgi:hypothetical protein